MSGSDVLTSSVSPADPMATPSATAVLDNPAINRPEPTVSADSPEVTQSADETPPIPPITIDARTQTDPNTMQSDPPADSPSDPVLPQSPKAPLSSDLSVSSPPQPVEQGIKDASGVPEPSLVQSSPSESARVVTDVQRSETKPESAGIAPDPSQASQEAPSADSQTTAEPKQSFGDLISDPQPPAQAPVLTIPETVQPLHDLSIPSIPSVPSQPPVSVDTSVPDLSEKRKQAIQARKQRVTDHLGKIVAFIGQKGKVNNRDIRDLLHVSQTTTSEYFRVLVANGKLKREGKAKATTYSLP